MAAVIQDGLALEYVLDKTDKICEIAIKNNPYAIRYVPKQTLELCCLAVKENPKAIKFIDKLDPILIDAISEHYIPGQLNRLLKKYHSIDMDKIEWYSERKG
jgi:hypothetical protein